MVHRKVAKGAKNSWVKRTDWVKWTILLDL